MIVRTKEGSEEKHYEIIEREGMKIFQCNQCKKSFTKRATFQMHYYNFHKEKTFKCNKCEKAFSIPSLLEEHGKKCNTKTRNANHSYKVFIDWDAKKKYQCEICIQCFEILEDFQSHSNLDHNDVLKSIPCKEELDTSENVTTHSNELIKNSKLNEVELGINTECISTSIKSEFVKQEQDPLQIDPIESTENTLEPQLILS